MKISVIIPVYNAEKAIKKCLDSVYASEFKDYEVIVVDDASTDSTADIAKEFNCRIVKSEGCKNRSLARNTGIKESKGDVLVFIDSDVTIYKNSLDIIFKTFEDNPQISGLSGLLSEYTPAKNFLTQYKNLYMHYTFKRMPQEVEFLYGGICALKRDDIYRHNLFFDKDIVRASDTELGSRMAKKGLKILLVKELEITHLKKYSPITFLKNEFFIPFDFTVSMLKNKGVFHAIKKTRFAHTSIKQVFSVGLALIIISLIPFIFINPKLLPLLLCLFGLFSVLNLDFLIFLKREKSTIFFLKSSLLLCIDFFIMGLGMITGGIYSLCKR